MIHIGYQRDIVSIYPVGKKAVIKPGSILKPIFARQTRMLGNKMELSITKINHINTFGDHSVYLVDKSLTLFLQFLQLG